MTGFDWQPLKTELEIWSANNLVLPIWWRDDDAVAPTPQLDRLQKLSQKTGMPVHLAVIPAGATQALAEYLEIAPEFLPVIHGFAHLNHAPELDKKSEFGAQRNVELARADILAGMSSLRSLFGSRLVPMFVPPWNRISPSLFPELVQAGFHAISTFAPRSCRYAVGNLEQINTHLDPINWHGARSLHEPDMLISQAVAILRNRRSEQQDADEPLGILTHHLVHDSAIWNFTEGLIETLLDGPTRIWTSQEISQGSNT